MLSDVVIAPLVEEFAARACRKIGDGTPEEVRGNQDVIDAYLGVEH